MKLCVTFQTQRKISSWPLSEGAEVEDARSGGWNPGSITGQWLVEA